MIQILARPSLPAAVRAALPDRSRVLPAGAVAAVLVVAVAATPAAAGGAAAAVAPTVGGPPVGTAAPSVGGATAGAVPTVGAATAGIVGATTALPVGATTALPVGGATATDPTGFCELSASEIAVGESVTVHVDPSPDVDDLQYDKYGTGEFGDLTDESQRTFTYEEPGTYAPQVRAWAYPSETSTTETCGEVRVVGDSLDAGFGYEPESPVAGEPVVFFASVAGNYTAPLQFAWDWTGDGEFDATTADPDGVEHAFPEPGEYVVTLRVTDDAGATATAERQVVVEAAATATPTGRPEATERPGPTATPSPAPGEPTAAWWYTPLGPQVGETVTLVAERTVEGTTYEWDLDGDGAAEATGPSTTHAFGTAGDHVVTLRVTAPGADALARSRTIPVAGARAPDGRADGAGDAGPSFWYTPLDPSPGESVVFVASVGEDEAAGFGWDLDGDGEVDQRGPVATHAFAANGSADVVLAVERPDGTTDRVEGNVTVAPSGNETVRQATGGSDAGGPAGGGPLDGLPVPGFGGRLALVAVALAVAAARGRRWWGER